METSSLVSENSYSCSYSRSYSIPSRKEDEYDREYDSEYEYFLPQLPEKSGTRSEAGLKPETQNLKPPI